MTPSCRITFRLLAHVSLFQYRRSSNVWARNKSNDILTNYNVKHIKDNIYGAEAKGNYFRLVTLETVHPNDKEFCPMILQQLWFCSMC